MNVPTATVYENRTRRVHKNVNFKYYKYAMNSIGLLKFFPLEELFPSEFIIKHFWLVWFHHQVKENLALVQIVITDNDISIQSGYQYSTNHHLFCTIPVDLS